MSCIKILRNRKRFSKLKQRDALSISLFVYRGLHITGIIVRANLLGVTRTDSLLYILQICEYTSECDKITFGVIYPFFGRILTLIPKKY